MGVGKCWELTKGIKNGSQSNDPFTIKKEGKVHDELFENGGTSHFVGASVIVDVSSGWLECIFLVQLLLKIF